MAKKPHQFPTNRIVFIVIIVGLIGLLSIVVLKYLYLKTVLNTNALQMSQYSIQQASRDSAEQALILNSTLITLPSVASPLYQNSAQMEAYVVMLSRQLSKDIVVMDSNKKILADTVTTNVGATYHDDANGEVTQVIADGKARGFVETSKDYPKGMQEVAIPLRSSTGKIIGAIIVSSGHTQQ